MSVECLSVSIAGTCLIQGKDLDFGQDDMNFLRQNIKETLLKTDKFKGQQLSVTDTINDDDLEAAFDNNDLVIVDTDYEFSGFNADEAVRVLGEAVDVFNLRYDSTTSDILKKLPVNADGVSYWFDRMSIKDGNSLHSLL